MTFLPTKNADGVLASIQRQFLNVEVDLLVTATPAVTQADKPIVLMIENKIDSKYRVLQPQRYRDQAEILVASGDAIKAVTIAVAPESYLNRNAGQTRLFDMAISYEQLREWLTDQTFAHPELERRSRVKSLLLDQAISKQKRTLPQVISPAVTLSWKEIYKVSSSDFADLNMPRPNDEKGPSSRSIDLPCITRTSPFNKARLEYVTMKGDIEPKPGTVTILLPGLGDRVDAAEMRLSGLLEPGMSFRKASGSLGVTTYVDLVELGKPFAPQLEKLVHALEIARVMRDWYERHRGRLASFASD